MRLIDFVRDNSPFLAAGFLLTFGSAFGQTFFISIFAGEIRAEFGLSHGQWGGIYSLGTTLSAVAMIWAGALTDVFRIRVLGRVVLWLLAAACLVMAWTPVAGFLVISVLLLRFAGQGMMSHLGAVAMARWFVATRGRALSIASLGFASAEAILPILFVALLGVFDWRWLWVACGAATLLLLPILSRLLRLERTPQSIAAESPVAGMGGRHWSRGDVLRGQLFWFLIPALLGPPAFNTAFFFQQVHFAEIKGWTHIELVAMFPLYTIGSVTALFVSGFLIDRFGTARMMPLYQLPMVAGFALFSVATTPLQAIPAFLCLAVTAGANATLTAAFWAEFYGTRHLGAIKAMAAAVMVLGSAIGPGITGVLIDFGIGIETQYLGIAAYFALTCLSVGIGIVRARADLAPAP